MVPIAGYVFDIKDDECKGPIFFASGGHELLQGRRKQFRAKCTGYRVHEPSAELTKLELAALGMSIVEIELHHGQWRFVPASPFNRRITGNTATEISGPLAGHQLLQTSADPSGAKVLGMLDNAAGGKTPWGTILSCERHFPQYFTNYDCMPAETKRLSARLPAPGGLGNCHWGLFEERFDLSQDPNEYNRFGYIVEIDPYDPTSKPKKRTALGRYQHQGAAPVIATNGHVVVYSADDAPYEYLYKFVTNGKFDPYDRAHNLRLLDHGTLYVAKFSNDGTGSWLPLVAGKTPLVGWSQAQVLLNTRGAADRIGATKLNRPAGMDVSPATGKVYVSLNQCGNTGVQSLRRNPENDLTEPREDERWGRIIELVEGADDEDDGGVNHCSLCFHWETFMRCGDPSHPEHGTSTYFAGFPRSQVSPIAAPDRLVSDREGNLWIATDGQPNACGFGQNDGVFACPTEGSSRGWNRQFLSGLPSSGLCGPEFAGDNRTMFCGMTYPGMGTNHTQLNGWPSRHPAPKPGIIAVRHIRKRRLGS